MRKMVSMFLLVLIFLTFLPPASAAQPVGSITASGAIRLAGADIPSSAARSLTLASGDVVETLSSTAVVMLPDSSRVLLEKNTRLRVKAVNGKTRVILEQGGLHYTTSPAAQLQIAAGGRTAMPKALSEGSLKIAESNRVLLAAAKDSVTFEGETVGLPATPGPIPSPPLAAAAWWWIWIGVAAGVATAVAVPLSTGGGKPPSPSQP